jgi:hypothetical protein
MISEWAYRKVPSSNMSRLESQQAFSDCLWMGFLILMYCDVLIKRREKRGGHCKLTQFAQIHYIKLHKNDSLLSHITLSTESSVCLKRQLLWDMLYIKPVAQLFLQKSVVYGMTSRPIFCSLGRGRSGPPTLYQLYCCCLEQYQGRQDRGGSWTKFAHLVQGVMWVCELAQFW